MLNKILQTKQEEIKNITLPEQADVQAISFYKALREKTREVALIAEIKKASPSKGIIRPDFNPVEIARGYEEGGANAISVLTDQQYFQGDITYLTAVKKVVNIPVMRKEFIIDSIQVEQSKRIGADAILLIAEALEPNKLYELYLQATELGMDCLVEVHAEQSLAGILEVFTPTIIGVNNRNLQTFETTLKQTETIASMIPEESLFVSESGIFTYNDIKNVAKVGADAVLVGESLMRAQTPVDGIESLFGVVRK